MATPSGTGRRAGRPKKQREGSVEISAFSAKSLYLAQTPPRSLRRLHRELQAGGVKISLRKLEQGSARDGWVQAAKEFDRKRDDEVAVLLQKESTDSPVRQVRLGQALQEVAIEGLDAILRSAPPNDLRALAAAAREGVQIERLALGEATSRSEVKVSAYNAIIVPIAQIFQDIVIPALVDAERDHVVRQFASQVDALKDVWGGGDVETQPRRGGQPLLAAPETKEVVDA